LSGSQTQVETSPTAGPPLNLAKTTLARKASAQLLAKYPPAAGPKRRRGFSLGRGASFLDNLGAPSGEETPKAMPKLTGTTRR